MMKLGRTNRVSAASFVALMAFAFMSFSSYAAVVDVAADFAAVQAAIDVASNGDTVRIAAGTVTAPAGQTLTIPSLNNFTLMGADPDNKTVILGAENQVVLTLNPVMSGLTLQNLVFRHNPGTTAASGNGTIFISAPGADADIEKFEDFVMDNCEIDGSNINAWPGMNAGGRTVAGQTRWSWAESFTIRNSKLYNINDWRVVDPAGGSGGWREYVPPVKVFRFENNELWNNRGAVTARCQWEAKTIMYITDNYVHDYYGPSQGGGGAFKAFFPGKVYFLRNHIENLPFFQGALGDEQSAQGAGICISDRRQLGDPPTEDPTEVYIAGNYFKNVFQAIYFDTFNIAARTKAVYLPTGVIEDNTIDGSTWAFMTKRDSELYPGQTGGQLVIQENNILNSQISDFYFRTGFQDNGEEITFQNNYFGDTNGDGVSDLNDAIFTADPDVGAPPINASQALPNANYIHPDRDGDGLLNQFESEKGLNPDNADSDNDGWPDGVEVTLGSVAMALDPNDWPGKNVPLDPVQYPAGWENADLDNDGFYGWYEVAQGTDHLNKASRPNLGDVNNSGAVDNVDAVIVYVGSLGLVDLAKYPQDRMDANLDGIINNQDAIILFNFFLGNIKILPLLP